jgi:hypothetical protein
MHIFRGGSEVLLEGRVIERCAVLDWTVGRSGRMSSKGEG